MVTLAIERLRVMSSHIAHHTWHGRLPVSFYPFGALLEHKTNSLHSSSPPPPKLHFLNTLVTVDSPCTTRIHS